MGDSDKDTGSQLSLTDLDPEPDEPPKGDAVQAEAVETQEESEVSAERPSGPDYSSWEEADEAVEEDDDIDDGEGLDDDQESASSDEGDGMSGISVSSWKNLGDDSDDDETSDPPPQDLEIPDLDEIARDPRLTRLVGTVLGGSIGDAVGNPTEFISSFEAIRRRYPPNGVEGFVSYRNGPKGRFAPFTDDTQMAEAVLRSLLWAREHEADLDATMNKMAEEFIEWANHPKGGHRAPGNACLSGCRALARGVHWSQAGGARAGGCGSVMRAYPFGLFYADDLSKAESWSVAHSKLTHGDPIALAASAAMAVGVARVFRGEPLSTVLSEMVAAACRYSARTASMMAKAIDEANEGVEPEVTLKRLEGWAAHEAIAAAVYIFARHADDPRAAIIEAANTPGDSDSLATLAGALTGCRCGLAALPEEWVRDVERVDEFIELACSI